MNKLYCQLAALAATFVFALNAGAQVIDIHPAGPSDGKIMTMEETVTGRNVYPTVPRMEWKENMLYLKGKEGITEVDPATGTSKEVTEEYEKPRMTGGKPVPVDIPARFWNGNNGLPEGAMGMDKGPKGETAFILEHRLYYLDRDGEIHLIAGDESIRCEGSDHAGENSSDKVADGNNNEGIESQGNFAGTSGNGYNTSGVDGIVYGESVSRNEFGINKGTFWSPDGRKLAFYRKDESAVTDFPLLDITTRTGTLKSIKYPMNGMASEKITLGVYTLPVDNSDTGAGPTVSVSGPATTTDQTGTTATTGSATNTDIIYLQVTDFGEDRYLTNISWSPDSEYILIQVLDRTQKHCRLNMYRAGDGAFVKTILTEDNDKYVEPSDPVHFIGDNFHFIYTTSNRDNWKALYLCDTLGAVRRITPIGEDVQFLDTDGNSIYYTSGGASPVDNHLFRVNLTPGKGKKAASAANTRIGSPLQLTTEPGVHRVQLSPDKKYFSDSYSSFNVPQCLSVKSTDGKTSFLLYEAEDPLADYATGEIEFGTVKSADGQYDNYYRLYRPANFDPDKKYPVILYVYGGPHSQMVRNSWLGSIRMWEEYMAQHGYVVYVQDNRGTSNRGLEYEQAIHRYCGQNEMDDQMAGVEMLRSLPYVDSERIGVHGWSYGGFMTISLITNFPETFKVAVAGGPVIDWRWYEIMYGERYMDTPETNLDGFEKTSLINKAKDLKGRLLICQGAIDETVVWEHSLSFINECIKNNIQVDYFPYPIDEHNVAGGRRIHLMDKVTLYFEDFL